MEHVVVVVVVVVVAAAAESEGNRPGVELGPVAEMIVELANRHGEWKVKGLAGQTR